MRKKIERQITSGLQTIMKLQRELKESVEFYEIAEEFDSKLDQLEIEGLEEQEEFKLFEEERTLFDDEFEKLKDAAKKFELLQDRINEIGETFLHLEIALDIQTESKKVLKAKLTNKKSIIEELLLALKNKQELKKAKSLLESLEE